jgi:hypothetical protein
MRVLLAIIITATLSFGCAMLEGEQTTTDSGGGGTTAAPTGGGESTPTVAAESAVTGQRIDASHKGPGGGEADTHVLLRRMTLSNAGGLIVTAKSPSLLILEQSLASVPGITTHVLLRRMTLSNAGEVIIMEKVLFLQTLVA